ncbi:hypothetical protein J4Q44_G00234730 [Coregonus suidteri]|uniref:Uncharacterized protein n=1 Tax=Coregonus suidteri TaxID=861788 RepID=A0AAN8LBA8_9TELE
MKTRDASPPVALHVYVPETTPVHVTLHLKKCQKSCTAKTPQGPSYCLEQLADLFHEDEQEQRMHGQRNKYGKNIDRLLMDVG